MKAPAFWWRPPGLAAALLTPAAAAYGSAAARRMERPGRRAAVPVVCVGNVTVGGVGKTPTALALAAELRAMGRRPAFLLRGYGGRLPGPVLVDPDRHGAEEVGDEALLLARAAPTVVSRDRPAGAALAARDGGCDVLVMDDGLQNPSLAKDLALAVFDGATGCGNGRVLPAGPLRAPMAAQWPRIAAILVVGHGTAGSTVAAEAAGRGLPVLRGHLRPADETRRLAGRRALAFAGIGRPEKFFATCRAIGLDVVDAHAFPDHHRYSQREVSGLLDRAEASGLLPVTTEKDATRFGSLRNRDPRLAGVETIAVTMAFDDPGEVRRLLARALG